MKKCHALLKDIFVKMPFILIKSYFTIKNGESTLSKIELFNTTVCTCMLMGVALVHLTSIYMEQDL